MNHRRTQLFSDTLRADPRNARRHGERDLGTIAASLALHGQQKPVVALRDGTVIAGSGTLEAARSLGWGRLAAVLFDGEDAARAAAYAVVDNRSAELSEWDFDALAAGLVGLPAELLSSVGFSPGELDALLGERRWEAPGALPPAEPFRGQRSFSVVALDREAAVEVERALADLRDRMPGRVEF